MYDASGEKVFAFNSSERYVIDAVVMRDCKRMAAVTLGESGGSFADTVNIYSLGSEKADSVNTLTGSLLLSLDSVAGTLSCLTDEGLTLFSANGTLAGSYRYEYPYLRGSSMGGDSFAALKAIRRSFRCRRRESTSPCFTATVWCFIRHSFRNMRALTGRNMPVRYSCARTVRRCSSARRPPGFIFRDFCKSLKMLQIVT